MWSLRFKDIIENKVKQLINVSCQAVSTQCVGNSDLHHQAESTTMAASIIGPSHISKFLASCYLLYFCGLLIWGSRFIIPTHAPSVFGVLICFLDSKLPSTDAQQLAAPQSPSLSIPPILFFYVLHHKWQKPGPDSKISLDLLTLHCFSLVLANMC